MRRLARGCDSVLDVGTGVMNSLRASPCRVKVGVDAHRPYLEQRRLRDAVPIVADARRIGELFVDGAVELVTIVDAIEHLPMDEALDVLAQAERIAARRVVVATARGEYPQAPIDHHGLGGDTFQEHRSTWEVEDLSSRGYRVAVLSGFHDAENLSFVATFGADAPPVDEMIAWKDTS